MRYIPAIICMLVTGLMAINHIEGWGWVLFVGLLCVGAASADARE